MELVVDNMIPKEADKQKCTLDERIAQIARAIYHRQPEGEFDVLLGLIFVDGKEHKMWNDDQIEAFGKLIDSAKTLVAEQKEKDSPQMPEE